MGHPAPRGNFRHLYINGHYWGLFNTCERPKASFAAAYLGGDKEDYDVVKVKGGYSEGDEDRRYQVFPTDGDFADWEKLNELSLRDLSQNDNYRALIGVRPDGRRDKGRERLLDPVNLVDYMLVVFWAGNLDAPISWFGNNRGGNNWYGIYNRRRNDGFRFIMWDAEHSLLDLYEDRQGPFPEGPTADRNNPMWLYQRCLANEEFRTLLADRIARHMFRGGVLTPEPSIARLHRRTDEVREALFGEAARWGNPRKTWEWALRDAAAEPEGDPAIENYQAWFREVDRLTNEYFPQRTAVVVDQLFSRGLYPDIPEIEHSWGAAGDGDRRALSLSAGEWQIVFTTNGEDPRLFGGGLNPKARVVEGPVPVGRKTRILCRAYDGTEWGPLREFVGSGKSRSSRVGD